MSRKNIYQLIIFISIFVILIAFDYYFFHQKSAENLSKINSQNDTNVEINENILNELVNIEFNSTDSDGNEFYINAERAIVEINNQDQNKINLEGVVSIINLKNKGIINIYASTALYDKVSHDTLFYNNVKSEFLDNSIISKNLDVLFTKKISKIYNDVIFENNKLQLNTDKILINMENGDIKLEMNDNLDKVKLFTKNEYFN